MAENLDLWCWPAMAKVACGGGVVLSLLRQVLRNC